MYSKSFHFITRSFAGLVVIVALLVAPAASPAATISVNDNTLGTATNQFEYSGTWGYASGYPGMYQGDEHYASGASAAYTVRFFGQQVKLYGTVASHHGNAGVSIDGGAEQVVDLYSVIRVEQKLIYTSPTLGPARTPSASAPRVRSRRRPPARRSPPTVSTSSRIRQRSATTSTPSRATTSTITARRRPRRGARLVRRRAWCCDPATDCFSSAARAGAARSRSTKAAPR